jgi:hypothetical protein
MQVCAAWCAEGKIIKLVRAAVREKALQVKKRKKNCAHFPLHPLFANSSPSPSLHQPNKDEGHDRRFGGTKSRPSRFSRPASLRCPSVGVLIPTHGHLMIAVEVSLGVCRRALCDRLVDYQNRLRAFQVLFPYDYIYPEQYNCTHLLLRSAPSLCVADMKKLKASLGKGHCVLEMPTGGRFCAVPPMATLMPFSIAGCRHWQDGVAAVLDLRVSVQESRRWEAGVLHAHCSRGLDLFTQSHMPSSHSIYICGQKMDKVVEELRVVMKYRSQILMKDAKVQRK